MAFVGERELQGENFFFRGRIRMSPKSLKIGVVLVASILLGGAEGRSELVRRSVMIVPPRPTIMKIAFDMVRLRGVSLVTYRESKKAGGSFVAYLWDASGRRWVDVAMNERGARGVFDGASFVVAIGLDEGITGRLLEDAGWTGPVRGIPSMDIATIVNDLNASYDLSAREWRWLAARYRLQLKDLKYEQRRYGRYGPPGTSPKRPVGVSSRSPLGSSDFILGSEKEAVSQDVVESVVIPVTELGEGKGFVVEVEEVTAPAQDVEPTMAPDQEERPEDK